MKYKNTSGFRSVVIIAGKKTIVFPDDVIDYPGELFNASFEKVPDSEIVNHKDRVIKRNSPQNDEKLSILQDKLEGVKKDTDNIAAIEEAHSKSSEEINELRKNLEEFKGTVYKRLEILKSVVQTLEYELGEVIGYDEDGDKDEVVEAKDAKPFRNKS